MAQTTILASGATAATSSDVVVAAGASVTIGLYVASGPFPTDARAAIFIDTPGADSRIAALDNDNRTRVIGGPCTARVVREQSGTAYGVYSET